MRTIAALLAMATSALAQPECAPVEIMKDTLGTRDEYLAFSGDAAGAQLQIYTNSESGAWSVLMLDGGMMCLLGRGRSHTAPAIEGRKG